VEDIPGHLKAVKAERFLGTGAEVGVEGEVAAQVRPADLPPLRLEAVVGAEPVSRLLRAEARGGGRCPDRQESSLASAAGRADGGAVWLPDRGRHDRRDPQPRTLWGAFSKRTAVLRIAPDRGKQHLHGLIGNGFAGVVGSDRFSAYNSLEPERRQVCWSHLRRDFTFHADLGSGPQEAFGLDGLEVTWNVFHAWKQFQQDGDRAALQQRVAAIKAQMWPLLNWGSTGKRQRHVRALAKNLLKLWPALWTFADVPDVEPTNNAAERGLRAAVIYRKLSLGSRSQGGERTIKRLLSVDQTCRLQRRSLYAYLSHALTAKARGDPVPLLA
jgi:transposase